MVKFIIKLIISLLVLLCLVTIIFALIHKITFWEQIKEWFNKLFVNETIEETASYLKI